MRRGALLLLVPVALLLVMTTVAQATAPAIQSVWIDRGRDTEAPDWANYHQKVVVTASDAEGASDINCVEIDDPAGGVHYLSICRGETWQVDANTVGCEWSEWGRLSPPTAGAYAVTVWANDGSDSLTTVAAPPVSETRPTLTAPVMDSVTSDTRPTFQWTAGTPGSCYTIHVEEEGTWGQVWSAPVGSNLSCLYRFDQPDPVELLQAGHTYLWKIESYSPINAGDPDPRVCISNGQFTGGRFTVYGPWPTLPTLPGKIAYMVHFWGDNSVPREQGGPIFGTSSIMEYNTDPTTRAWLGPVGAAYPDWASCPEWSPDGSKLMYSMSGGVWVNKFDGNPPSQIPGISGGDCRWAPDGHRVVYTVWNPPNAYTWPWGNVDIWIANDDGTDARPLVASEEYRERWPVWSADGMWLAYGKASSGGDWLWLIRYDGTDDHALVATGVDGYPGYVVDWIGWETAWKPDGKEIATIFSANDGLGNWIQGVGAISRDGGMMKPVFLSPNNVICCAQTHLPQWSPDGTKIVFNSGHHLDPADLPGWGEFSTGPELWMMNADGTGTPTRLTYDYSYDSYVSWWAPNTAAGGAASVTKGDTTVNFGNVTGTGSTSITVFNEPPGPEPAGFEFMQDYYEISTTAAFTGPITVSIHYDDTGMTLAEEQALSLVHWEGGKWVDITVRPIDTVNNIITGQCASLSPFGLALGPRVIGPLQPVNQDGSSVFKQRSTLPVKFQLLAPDGSYVGNATAKLYYAKVSSSVTGDYAEAVSTAQSDVGNTFRYDAAAHQYIFNLSLKNLSTGTWRLRIEVNGLVAKEFGFSITK